MPKVSNEEDASFVSAALPHLMCIIGDSDRVASKIATDILCEFGCDEEFEEMFLSYDALQGAIDALPETTQQENIVSVLLMQWTDKKLRLDLPTDTLEYVIGFLRRAKKIRIDHVHVLSTLCKDEGMRLPLANAGIIPMLEHIVAHGAAEETEQYAAAALWNLTAAKSIKPIVLSSRVFPAIIDLLAKLQEANKLHDHVDIAISVPTIAQVLRHGHGKIKKRAVDLLGGIIECSKGTSCFKRILDAEILPLLIQLLHQGGENRRYSLTLLARASRLAANAFSIVSAGGIRALIRAICRGEREQQRIAIALLEESLCSMNQDFPQVTVNEMTAITDLMHDSHESTRFCCLQVLGYLSNNTSNIVTMLSTDAVASACRVLKDSDPIPRNAAADLLLSLCVKNEGKSAVTKSGVIKTLVPMIGDGTLIHSEAAISLLTKLARDSLENKSSIAYNGGIPPMIALVQSDGGTLREHALLGLITLSIKSDENKQKISAAGIIPSLVWILRHERSRNARKLQCKAMTLLKSLALDSNNEKLIVAAGAIEPIAALIPERNYDAAWIAMTTLQNLAGMPRHKRAITETVGCIGAILSRLDGTNDKLSMAALGILRNLVVNSGFHLKAILANRGASILLKITQNASDSQKRLQALSILNELNIDSTSRTLVASGETIARPCHRSQSLKRRKISG